MTANFTKLSFRPNAAERVFLEQFAQRNGTTSVTQTLHMLIAECTDRGVGGWGGSSTDGGCYSYPSANDRQINIVTAGDGSSFYGQQPSSSSSSSSSSFTLDSVNNNNFNHEYNIPKQLPHAKPSLRQQQRQQQLPRPVLTHATTDTLDGQASATLFYVYNVLPIINPPLASYIINSIQQNELRRQQISMRGQMLLQQQQQQQYYASVVQQPYLASSSLPSSPPPPSALQSTSVSTTNTNTNNIQTKPRDFLDVIIETTEKTARLGNAMRVLNGW